MKPIFKKIFLVIILGITFQMFYQSALALTLDETFKPETLPSFDIVTEPTDPSHPETAATQTAILFIGKLLSQVLLFSASIAIIFIIIAGGYYIFSFGKDQSLEKGKRGLTWSITGLILILLSYAIVQGVISILLQVDSTAQGV